MASAIGQIKIPPLGMGDYSCLYACFQILRIADRDRTQSIYLTSVV